jgi:hypothetical protein
VNLEHLVSEKQRPLRGGFSRADKAPRRALFHRYEGAVADERFVMAALRQVEFAGKNVRRGRGERGTLSANE